MLLYLDSGKTLAVEGFDTPSLLGYFALAVLPPPGNHIIVSFSSHTLCLESLSLSLSVSVPVLLVFLSLFRILPLSFYYALFLL